MSEEQEPSLEDVLGDILDARAADLHVALPGKVVRYDAAKQVADIQPQLRDVFVGDDGEFVDRPYPVLPRVPVQFLRGGGFFVIVPVAEGDTGLLVFADLPLDRWRSSGQASHPGDVRRHSMTSAVFIPGLVPTAAALSEASANADLVLGKAGGLTARVTAGGLFQVGAGASFVALATKVATELSRINSDLSALKTAIQTGLTNVGVALAANGPAAAATFAASTAAIPSTPGDVASTKVKAD